MLPINLKDYMYSLEDQNKTTRAHSFANLLLNSPKNHKPHDHEEQPLHPDGYRNAEL